MAFNAQKFLEDHNIEYATEGENIGHDFIGINCPICGDSLFHGGFHKIKGYYTCWRCGGHRLEKVIVTLLPWVTYSQAEQLIKQYQIVTNIIEEKKRTKRNRVPFPINCGPLQEKHRKYLLGRNFDPDQLEKDYYLLGTGPLGNYKHRIIAPIFLNKRMVSYHSRDITGKQISHKACAKEDEIIEHKHTFYNFDNLIGPDGIIVEGLADCWRLGPENVIASFGTSFTPQQVKRLIAKRESIKRLFILFDTEEEDAMRQAQQLALQLNSLGITTEVIELVGGDPAQLSNEEAKKLRKELLE